jgi:DNA-binding NtrC family response regulator
LANRKGMLEAADGGTLFLDEIGDMPAAMQAKLLRALENGEVMPVGSTELKHVDVRFVAATHHDLWARVEEKEFREDLFYRLHANGAIRIPPLRERREDIPLLVQHFIERSNEENGTNIEGLTPEAMRKLTQHSWRGNVRELRHVIERMGLEAEGKILTADDLPDNLRGSTEIVPAGLPSLAGLSMAEMEKLHIMNTLRMYGGNREKTAKALKIGARTLYRKLNEYGLR